MYFKMRNLLMLFSIYDVIFCLTAQTVVSNPPVSQTVTVNNTGVFVCRASYNLNELDIVYEWEFNGRILDIENSNHHRKVIAHW